MRRKPMYFSHVLLTPDGTSLDQLGNTVKHNYKHKLDINLYDLLNLINIFGH
jgi:hypothetical protein